jgi:hypothetical protein
MRSNKALPPAMKESHAVPAITDFPLIWRWTRATHALFSASELAGLRPCSLAEAAKIHDDSRSFNLRDGLDERQFRGVRVQSADIPTSDGCSWLRAQAPNITEQVTVSWDRDTALRTSWEFFTAHWDDFCYPSSDDVLVLPDSRSWVLRYHHEEIFYFGDRNA